HRTFVHASSGGRFTPIIPLVAPMIFPGGACTPGMHRHRRQSRNLRVFTTPGRSARRLAGSWPIGERDGIAFLLTALLELISGFGLAALTALYSTRDQHRSPGTREGASLAVPMGAWRLPIAEMMHCTGIRLVLRRGEASASVVMPEDDG